MDSPEARALDKIAHDYALTETRLERLRTELQAAVIAAVRAGMSRAEAGRRSGYTREYVSKMVTTATAQNASDEAG